MTTETRAAAPRLVRAAFGVTMVLLAGLSASRSALATPPGLGLPDSDFEIDSDANSKMDDPGDLDWGNVNDGRKSDRATGQTDDSFGNGTKEDTAVPSVVAGQIPNNKSDLKTFGAYLEKNPDGRFLHLFWTRVQEPTGTTNMDFEFNQSKRLSSNGVTPVRTAGDLLIGYDLSQGGTHPVLTIRRWSGSAWGPATDLSAAGDAAGSINTSPIPAAESDGLGALGARTFGEASLDLDAILDSTKCVSFGSAFLKSRSSDSFTSAIKDFIAPQDVQVTNCGKVIIRKQTDPSGGPSFGFTKSFLTDPVTQDGFSLADGGVMTFDNARFGAGLTVTETLANGWDLASIDCSASVNVTPVTDPANRKVTFDLDDEFDVVDCTFTNRARGTLVVRKITSDGTGTFNFSSSGGLSPSTFPLTTTSPGAGGADQRTFAEILPGVYAVSESVPAGWNLVGQACDDGSDPGQIRLDAGETVTCTFTNARQRGAIRVQKVRKHAADGPGDHAQSNVTFTVTGGELPSAGVRIVTDANGAVCLDGLVLGGYTVTETVPSGYVTDGPSFQTVNLAESTCENGPIVTFRNIPLTNVTVTVHSQVPGGTRSFVNCTGPSLATGDLVTDGSGDRTVQLNALLPRYPTPYVCTINIDP